MPVHIMNFRFQDSETDSKPGTLPIYVPDNQTLAQYQAFATTAATTIDAVSGAKIVGIDMKVNLSLVGATIKAVPVAGHVNERGGLLGMDTAGQFDDSIRVPAIKNTLMSGDSFSLADPLIQALTLLLTAGDGVVFPRNRDGFIWQGTGLYGKKSVRRK
jgi:hypothetical protein